MATILSNFLEMLLILAWAFPFALAAYFWGKRGVTKTEKDLAARNQEIQGLNERIRELQSEREKQQSELNLASAANRQDTEQWQQKLAQRDIEIARLTTQIKNEQVHATEQAKLWQQAEQHLSTSFENLANRILEDKGEKITAQNKKNIDQVLSPLREQLLQFRKRIDDVYDKEAKDRRTLYDEVVNLKSLSEGIKQEAINLTNALKGDSKQLGDWGELVLERVLEGSGLTRGREYEVQDARRSADGKWYRPDVVIKLPENRHVIIDSKVSLQAYDQYHAAEEEELRQEFLQQHVQALRRHVKDLQKKDYPALEGLNAPDMVLMFVPIEPALLCAFDHDWGLFQEAFEAGVFIVSPSTLLMNLHLIHNLWKYEYQGRNASKIAAHAASLYDKFAGFYEKFTEIGVRLQQAAKSYDTAEKRLVTGKGNLIHKIEHLRKMGISPKKNLPINLEFEEEIEEIDEAAEMEELDEIEEIEEIEGNGKDDDEDTSSLVS